MDIDVGVRCACRWTAAVVGRQPRHSKNILESSSDEESDNEIKLLITAVGMVNEKYPMPPCKDGSSKKRLPNVDCDREAGHLFLAWLSEGLHGYIRGCYIT
jgi:hypothetical protein